MARAIWRQVSRRGWSSRTNDHWRIVTGPVSMPFIGRSVSDWACRHQRDRHRRRARDVAVEDRRLHAAAAVGLHPAVRRRRRSPRSCWPKYSTMSLRSGSPCTSTSRPSRSWTATTSAIRSSRNARSRPASSAPLAQVAARGADLVGLRERADRRRGQLGQREARALERAGARPPGAPRSWSASVSGRGARAHRRVVGARRGAPRRRPLAGRRRAARRARAGRSTAPASTASSSSLSAAKASQPRTSAGMPVSRAAS